MAVAKSTACCIILILSSLIVNSSVHLKAITEESWQEILNGEWMIEFFAPWCPACRQLEPVWKEFASWSEDLGIRVGSIDVTTNPGLSGRFAITALPTIFHVKDGVFRQYRGSKRKHDLMTFIEDAKWKDIDPIPSWKSPQSIHLAYFFKFSMFLRNVHNDLVEFGIPYWGSYIIFGLATIFLGAILGLLIVYLIDHIFPGKRPPLGTESRATQKPESVEAGTIYEEKIVSSIQGDKGKFSYCQDDDTGDSSIEEERSPCCQEEETDDSSADEEKLSQSHDEDTESSAEEVEAASPLESGEGSGPNMDRMPLQERNVNQEAEMRQRSRAESAAQNE